MININGVWQAVEAYFIRIAGQWVKAHSVWVNSDGAWKQQPFSIETPTEPQYGVDRIAWLLGNKTHEEANILKVQN